MEEVTVSFDPRRHGVDDPDEIADVAGEVGLRAIEWPVVTEEDLRAVPSFAAPLSLVTLRVLRSDLHDSDGFEFVCAAIAVAAERGCSLVAGPAGDSSTPAARHAAFERLRRIEECAAEHCVVYALETGPGLCGSHRMMLDTLHELKGIAIGLSFDPVILHAGNDFFNAEVALAKVCHRVVHLRAGDCSGEPGDSRSLPLGTGAVDFVRMGELLRVSGFRGPYCLSLPSTVGSAADLSTSLRESVVELRRCGVLRG